jgi:hypothetical protein
LDDALAGPCAFAAAFSTEGALDANKAAMRIMIEIHCLKVFQEQLKRNKDTWNFGYNIFARKQLVQSYVTINSILK